MKKTAPVVFLLTVFLTVNLFGCKKNEQQPKTPESPEVTNLKQFYAATANVKVDLVNYDASKDEFSINGNSKITHAKLLMFYGLSQNKGSKVPAKSASVHN